MSDKAAIDKVIDFWFGPAGSTERETGRKQWWVKDEAFDASVRETLGDLHARAAAGELNDWTANAEGAAALVILLDQVPRNIYRGSPKSFATDAAALAVTKDVLARGLDQSLPELMRMFLYLPLEHSEDIEDQERCITLMDTLTDKGYLDFAIRHRDIIARFGRFPHRNEVLGRTSTPEEIDFLKEPGSSF